MAIETVAIQGFYSHDFRRIERAGTQQPDLYSFLLRSDFADLKIISSNQEFENWRMGFKRTRMARIERIED